jgi:hypothetical protein
MEGIYGSDITVSNAIVGDGFLPGELGPDHYIQDAGFGQHWIEISFNDVPITSAEFDWGVELDDFHAYADGVEFFNTGWEWGPFGSWTSGHTGPYVFATPVTTLRFSNSWFGEIEVDNLDVTPVPEPTTMLLLGFGLLGLIGYGIHRKRKNL